MLKGLTVAQKPLKDHLEVVGHKEVPGRPELLATSKQFLDDLGLQSLRELPPLAELGNLLLSEEPSE